MFYAFLLQPNLKHLHKEKYPTKCQEHPPLAALKTLDTVNEQEIDLIPDDTEVWIHTFKYNHINNYTVAHCDNATNEKLHIPECYGKEELILIENSVKASPEMYI